MTSTNELIADYYSDGALAHGGRPVRRAPGVPGVKRGSPATHQRRECGRCSGRRGRCLALWGCLVLFVSPSLSEVLYLAFEVARAPHLTRLTRSRGLWFAEVPNDAENDLPSASV